MPITELGLLVGRGLREARQLVVGNDDGLADLIGDGRSPVPRTRPTSIRASPICERTISAHFSASLTPDVPFQANHARIIAAERGAHTGGALFVTIHCYDLFVAAPPAVPAIVAGSSVSQISQI